MSLLGRFDLSTDLTQFYLWGLVILLIFTVLLTWVAPRGNKVRGRPDRVDDRYASFEGELID